MVMKIEVDWDKAPEGTTHYGPETDRLHAAWYKKVDSRWMVWIVDVSNEWHYTGGLPSGAIAHPAEWDGTGLPALGTKCEVLINNKMIHVCTVVAHFEGRAVVVLGNRESAQIRDAEQLRPIRTPEQIAAEKPEREINDLATTILSICDSMDSEDPRDLAKALHNVGYRKTEQEKNNEQ